MVFNISIPAMDHLLTGTPDSVGLRHRVQGLGCGLDLIVQSDRILAYRDEEERPVAVLRFGGPNSGASGTIWVSGELVGEYEKDREGKFLVTEIEAGFKMPNSRRQLDPVAHIVELVGCE